MSALLIRYDTKGNVQTSYSYNQDGQLTSKINNKENTEYKYDTFGNLKEVILPNNDKITYIYNANNQRTAKLINNQIEEKYLWLNLTTLLAVYDKDDNLIARFYYLDDRVPYKVKYNNQIYYLSYNHQGTLNQVTDINAKTVKSIIYSTYGNIIEDTNPNINIPFGFAGGLYDKDTKLIKFGYRDYDPNTGKWITKDPIRFDGGDSNLYNYVVNDPVNGVDPEGLADMNLFDKNTEYNYYFPAFYTGMFSSNFIVSGHGSAGYVYDGNTAINGQKLSELIEKHPKYKDGQAIEILSCDSGTNINGEDSSLAQEVANKLGVPVTGVKGYYMYHRFFSLLNGPKAGASMQTFYPKKSD
jgi:RHS repeat-associated protein